MMRRTKLGIALAAGLAVVLAALASLGGGSATARQARTIPLGPGPVVVPGVTSSPKAAVTATNHLALQLLNRLGGTGSNATFSPYSIEAALAMVDQGARGETATQIGHVLSDSSASGLAYANEVLRQDLESSGKQSPTLDIANSIWIQSGLSVKPAFTSVLRGQFTAAPQLTDFATAPENARQAINGWVAAHTGNLIQNLFPEGTITAQTAMVLADAIYLKARWETPFQTNQTAPAAFYPATGSSVQAPFMSRQGGLTVPYATGPGYRAVDLPYAGSNLSMLAVMPSAGTLPQFQRKLTTTGLAKITGALHTTDLNVFIPRLNLSFHADLSGVLSALGMPQAFTNQADFGGISSKVALQIEDVQHAAVLKVDEAGTVAAAATGISIEPTAVVLGPSTTFRLNHPFLLFLRDDTTGAVLFAARVANPLAG